MTIVVVVGILALCVVVVAVTVVVVVLRKRRGTPGHFVRLITFTARHVNAVLAVVVCQSVRPLVRHTPVLYQNG